MPDNRLTELEKKIDELEMLMDVSAIISSTLDLSELTALVMEKAKYVMRADACSILLFNRKTGRLEFDLALGSDARDGEILKKHVTLGLGEGIAGWVAEHREPVLVTNAADDSRFFTQADNPTGFTTKSIIAVPLVGRAGTAEHGSRGSGDRGASQGPGTGPDAPCARDLSAARTSGRCQPSGTRRTGAQISGVQTSPAVLVLISPTRPRFRGA